MKKGYKQLRQDAINESSNFLAHHGLRKDSNGTSQFEATVSYRSPKTKVTTCTEVTIHGGYKSGTIWIKENDDLDSIHYHLELSPDFQTYSFSTDSEELIINGFSDKMGGKYTVNIGF